MQIFLLCLIFTGFITVKVRIVDEHTRSSITDLILFIFIPCNILSSFFGTDRSQISSLGIIMLISLGVLVLSFVLSKVLYKRAGPEQKKVLVYATLISNAGFLGNPVVESIYGLESLPYVAAYLLPLRVAVWTVGIAVFTGGKSNLKKVIFHPCLIATYLGLIVMISGFSPPVLVSRLVFSLGNITTPLSMMMVGCILAKVDPGRILNKLTVYYTFVRLVLLPLLVMGILFPFRPAPMISSISVLLSGMPTGITTFILADKYGGDTELASGIIFVSTILSIITAPLLAWFFQMVV